MGNCVDHMAVVDHAYGHVLSAHRRGNRADGVRIQTVDWERREGHKGGAWIWKPWR